MSFYHLKHLFELLGFIFIARYRNIWKIRGQRKHYYFVPCLHLDLQNKLSGQKGHLQARVSMESLYLLGKKAAGL